MAEVITLHPGRKAPAASPAPVEVEHGQADAGRLEMMTVVETDRGDGTTDMWIERQPGVRRTWREELTVLPLRFASAAVEWVLMMVRLTVGRLAAILGTLSIVVGLVLVWWPERSAWPWLAWGLGGLVFYALSVWAHELVEFWRMDMFLGGGRRRYYRQS